MSSPSPYLERARKRVEGIRRGVAADSERFCAAYSTVDQLQLYNWFLYNSTEAFKTDADLGDLKMEFTLESAVELSSIIRSLECLPSISSLVSGQLQCLNGDKIITKLFPFFKPLPSRWPSNLTTIQSRSGYIEKWVDQFFGNLEAYGDSGDRLAALVQLYFDSFDDFSELHGGALMSSYPGWDAISGVESLGSLFLTSVLIRESKFSSEELEEDDSRRLGDLLFHMAPPIATSDAICIALAAFIVHELRQPVLTNRGHIDGLVSSSSTLFASTTLRTTDYLSAALSPPLSDVQDRRAPEVSGMHRLSLTGSGSSFALYPRAPATLPLTTVTGSGAGYADSSVLESREIPGSLLVPRSDWPDSITAGSSGHALSTGLIQSIADSPSRPEKRTHPSQEHPSRSSPGGNPYVTHPRTVFPNPTTSFPSSVGVSSHPQNFIPPHPSNFIPPSNNFISEPFSVLPARSIINASVSQDSEPHTLSVAASLKYTPALYNESRLAQLKQREAELESAKELDIYEASIKAREQDFIKTRAKLDSEHSLVSSAQSNVNVKRRTEPLREPQRAAEFIEDHEERLRNHFRSPSQNSTPMESTSAAVKCDEDSRHPDIGNYPRGTFLMSHCVDTTVPSQANKFDLSLSDTGKMFSRTNNNALVEHFGDMHIFPCLTLQAIPVTPVNGFYPATDLATGRPIMYSEQQLGCGFVRDHRMFVPRDDKVRKSSGTVIKNQTSAMQKLTKMPGSFSEFILFLDRDVVRFSQQLREHGCEAHGKFLQDRFHRYVVALHELQYLLECDSNPKFPTTGPSVWQFMFHLAYLHWYSSFSGRESNLHLIFSPERLTFNIRDNFDYMKFNWNFLAPLTSNACWYLIRSCPKCQNSARCACDASVCRAASCIQSRADHDRALLFLDEDPTSKVKGTMKLSTVPPKEP